jgi:hypothetical protein
MSKLSAALTPKRFAALAEGVGCASDRRPPDVVKLSPDAVTGCDFFSPVVPASRQ